MGKGNANCSPDFQKYRSNFTETRHFKRKIHIFLGIEGPTPRSHFSPQPSLLDPSLRPAEFQPDLGLWISTPTNLNFHFEIVIFGAFSVV